MNTSKRVTQESSNENMPTRKEKRYRQILVEFIEDIQVTGGIRRDANNYPRPVADADWIDLGETYLKACAALGQKPVESDGDDTELVCAECEHPLRLHGPDGCTHPVIGGACGCEHDADADRCAIHNWGKANGVWHRIAKITGDPYGATRTCVARCGRTIEAGSRTLIDLPLEKRPGRRLCPTCVANHA